MARFKFACEMDIDESWEPTPQAIDEMRETLALAVENELAVGNVGWAGFEPAPEEDEDR